MIFERASLNDAEAMVRVQVAAFHHDAVLYPGVEESGPPGYNSVRHMQQAIQQNECYKIVVDGQIIGGMTVFIRGAGLYHLDVIFIDPQWHNRGVGTQALQFLEATYPARLWTLDTPLYAIRNQHFYEKMGFVKVNHFDVDGFALIAYEKRTGNQMIKPDESTLHGRFTPERPPILRVKSGDMIEAATLDAGWGMEPPHPDGTPRQKHPKSDAEENKGHALIGPVWIDGAKPGQTLVVHIEALTPGAYGYTISGAFPHRVNQALNLLQGEEEVLVWSLDTENMIGTTQHGHKVRLKPFLGVIGMPPPEPGLHPTDPPRMWGGNIDCKDLVVGTKLYLPIPVEGGLLSFGDGHAAQGHGEVSVTAVECPMDYVRLKVEVLENLQIQTPRAWTPQGWLTFGFHEDLEEATYIALDAMVTLMMEQHGFTSRKQALGIATAVVDLHITQIANPTMGVHAFLPHDALV